MRRVLAHLSHLRAAAAGAGAGVVMTLVFKLWPSLELAWFARAAARLAALLVGSPVSRVQEGWQIEAENLPMVVTRACSACDYTVLVSVLVTWHLVRQGRSFLAAIGVGCLVSAPFAIGVNALRIVVVTQAHAWVIPRLPEVYHAFLHLLTGAAVFLPALILLNACLHRYGRPYLAAGTPRV